ncbi:unnamed protein product [Owenia fusiformis]|uniref:Uncharacterized protein n=1 Tax=Owenia fusiformis TaxID=6347 RepID=A0A8J1YA87_OWEFU|nr:unnamed protein product [Owenia fusiformis]
MEFFRVIRDWMRTFWFIICVANLAHSASIRKLLPNAPVHGLADHSTGVNAKNNDLNAFHYMNAHSRTKRKINPEKRSEMEHNLIRNQHDSSEAADSPTFGEILNINTGFSGDSDYQLSSEADESIERTDSRDEIEPVNPFSQNILHKLESLLRDSFARDRRAAPSAAFGRASCCIGDIWCFRPCIFAHRILTSSSYSRRKRGFRASWGQTDEVWFPVWDLKNDDAKINILKYLVKKIHDLRIETMNEKNKQQKRKRRNDELSL